MAMMSESALQMNRSHNHRTRCLESSKEPSFIAHAFQVSRSTILSTPLPLHWFEAFSMGLLLSGSTPLERNKRVQAGCVPLPGFDFKEKNTEKEVNEESERQGVGRDQRRREERMMELPTRLT
ncbi:hypothetical protein H6P81_019731 [Aristolochia fimbriata]|uniref:Uncharacterized protein n=1 Tax=Aristolochia fimbriata TaxID=158543 RepID=A0AAV7DTR5_ARIFI|nr:hypothetical protein H6P81_019731 [Aristolochia fimbriata]